MIECDINIKQWMKIMKERIKTNLIVIVNIVNSLTPPFIGCNSMPLILFVNLIFDNTLGRIRTNNLKIF